MDASSLYLLNLNLEQGPHVQVAAWTDAKFEMEGQVLAGPNDKVVRIVV